MRHFGSRPLIKDNSVRSASSALTHIKVGWRPARHIAVPGKVFNIIDRKVRAIHGYDESRLKFESTPVADFPSFPPEPCRLWFALCLSGR